MLNLSPTNGRNVVRALAILAATAILCWPAILNRYPLFYSDSIAYLLDSLWLLPVIRDHSWPHAVALRSEMYSIVCRLLDGGSSPWPIVAAQSLLTGWILWLAVRSQRSRLGVAHFVGIVALLSFFTSIAWYTSCIMPDALGPALYLGLFVLVFCWEDLRPWEIPMLLLIAWWCITSHSSHLLVAAGLWTSLALLWLARWRGMRGRAIPLSVALALLLAAIASQVAVHAWVYRKPSVFGMKPPFLMARFLADGPAQLYLENHCSTLHWYLCTRLPELPQKNWEFLWQPRGIYLSSTLSQQRQLEQEEMPLVLGTLRTYPLAQAKRLLANFKEQLFTLGPADFTDFPGFNPERLNVIFPDMYLRYSGSLQSRNLLPQEFFSALQGPVMLLSLLVIVGLLPRVWRAHDDRLLALLFVVLLAVPANAFVTGALSGISARYQGRVAWLVPLLALLFLCARPSSGTAGADLPSGQPAA